MTQGAAPADEPQGDAPSEPGARREGALARLKRALAERERPAPQLEGYALPKARKILRLLGIDDARVKVKYVEDERERGLVVDQRPRPGDPVDLSDADEIIELKVADSSIVRYLPQIFQRSDLTGRNFVRDLLWIGQHIHNQTDEKLEGLERYFDPLEAPREFLDYMASWVALAVEDDWPEFKKRSLIRRAVELYHLRGTPRGLRIYLRIFTGVDPKIHENVWPFSGIVVGESSTVGVDTVLMHAVEKAHAFIVEIPVAIDDVDALTIRRIHRIIEREKPVHTDYYLVFAQPEEKEETTGITVGITSTVGVDTWLAGDDAESYFPLEDEGGMEMGAP